MASDNEATPNPAAVQNAPATKKKVAAKKVATKKATAKKVVTKKTTTTKKSPAPATKKTVTAAKASPVAEAVHQEVSHQERYEMIANMAYFRAEQRGFEPGWEVHDWLESERLIDEQLRNRGRS